MKELIVENNKFICFDCFEAEFVFSTAENGLNFNKSISEGIGNIEKLKNWFDLDEVGYCNQTHSNIVKIYSVSNIDGDSIITNKKRVAVGVFTADCVPVLLFDKENKVVAAVHSGWRGTVKNIVSKSVEKMVSEFNSKAENITAYIGPHNRNCCYEVGQEVIDEFNKNVIFNSIDFVFDRKINLAKCITVQLLNKGVLEENIFDTRICTFCSQEYKLHSYRKAQMNYGRMFSFIYIKY